MSDGYFYDRREWRLSRADHNFMPVWGRRMDLRPRPLGQLECGASRVRGLTTYSLMSGQKVPTNQPGATQPASVVLTGNPTYGRVTFSLSRAGSYAEASLWGQMGVTFDGYEELSQVCTLAIAPGQPLSISYDLQLPAFQNVFARLNEIDRSQQVAASMTLVV